MQREGQVYNAATSPCRREVQFPGGAKRQPRPGYVCVSAIDGRVHPAHEAGQATTKGVPAVVTPRRVK